MVTAWLFHRDPGERGILCTTPTATSETDPRILNVELCGGCGEAYVRNVLFEATQEVESNDGCGEVPVRDVVVVVIARQAASGPDMVFLFTRPGEV